MRGWQPVGRVLGFGLEGDMDVQERSSAVWPDAPGAGGHGEFEVGYRCR